MQVSGDPISRNDGILIWMAIDTISGQGADIDMWGKNGGNPYWTGTDIPDYQLYMAGSLWQGYVSRAVAGVFPVDDGGVNYNSFSTAGISVDNSASLTPSVVWGVPDCDDSDDQANLQDYIVQGHTATDRDSFYEIAIPLTYLGIDRSYLENTGVGVLIGAGSYSCLDSIPNDATTNDTPGTEVYNSTFEWADDDEFTCDFARVGHAK
jgi:hypothetical protein